jgi:hypothetical protein
MQSEISRRKFIKKADTRESVFPSFFGYYPISDMLYSGLSQPEETPLRLEELSNIGCGSKNHQIERSRDKLIMAS